jgi:hypothetical protein
VVPSDLGVLRRMVDRAEWDGHDWLAAPYPRKRIPTRYPYRPLRAAPGEPTGLRIVNDCAEVEACAIGFTLTRRSCLARMVDHYREEEWFTDVHDPVNPHETVAIFRQIQTPTEYVHGADGGTMRYRDLLSEDYSACHRWRAMGGKVHMFVGEGSPVGHVGGQLYQGTRAELGQCL